MTFLLPERTHLVMKAVDPEKLSKKELAKWLIRDAADYRWEVKYDGCSLIIIVTEDDCYLFSRQGEVVRSLDHIRSKFKHGFHPGNRVANMVYFAEAWSPYHTFEQISGMFRQHSQAQDLQAIVFDAVPLEDFMRGKYDTHYDLRREVGLWSLPSNFQWAAGFATKEECENYVAACRSSGMVFATDGCVVRARRFGWTAGTAKRGETVKQKDKLTLDLHVVDLIEGEGEWAGEVGAFVCQYGKHTINAQRGQLTKAEAAFLWENRDDTLAAGLIIEVAALSGSSKGKLREPHYVRTRNDKLPHEVD